VVAFALSGVTLLVTSSTSPPLCVALFDKAGKSAGSSSRNQYKAGTILCCEGMPLAIPSCAFVLLLLLLFLSEVSAGARDQGTFSA
jgi:hypothetical protein